MSPTPHKTLARATTLESPVKRRVASPAVATPEPSQVKHPAVLRERPFHSECPTESSRHTNGRGSHDVSNDPSSGVMATDGPRRSETDDAQPAVRDEPDWQNHQDASNDGWRKRPSNLKCLDHVRWSRVVHR